ncbi:MAG: hypothetical protein COY58_00285 [Gammaproteobacteria bacterium CG_4_10_14_0_8_um_filter_38_16]|nr:MAG: hypothetical protein COY58_00285 [Gammaproteobacteria bacterium CG_4_10_14_0_8_um_filter_38_16]PJA02767.1 MAG: hypothetical protein COX72_08230 [Gammaproteobacteria bacterium CG_4_10_14_0_2_um_filter_38_22]PJB10409.1 MAG: hypothetical protein CO120_04970 [Gammaproteobacteria bacterium CG_4_9_14_3_um_filter_38_9]
MIILLSPTKTQSNLKVKNNLPKIKPMEIEKANDLMSLLRKLSVDELARLMKISNTLAIRTKNSIDIWEKNKANTTQAIHLFQGDAFQKLDADSLNEDELLFSQDHLIILSALYGYLRPFDSVAAYRLDMKDPLVIPGYRNLYEYWKETVNLGLNNLLLKQKNNIILNLASSEYIDILNKKKFTGNIVNVEFKVHKDNSYKTVGIYAKRGRGLLARYIIKNRIDSPEKIVRFNFEGFHFSEKLSTPHHYVFICVLQSERLFN